MNLFRQAYHSSVPKACPMTSPSRSRGRSRSRSFPLDPKQSPAAVRDRSPPRRSISPRSGSHSRSRSRPRSAHGHDGPKRNGVKGGRSRTRSLSRSASRGRSYSRSLSRDSPIPRSSKVCQFPQSEILQADDLDCRRKAHQECQRRSPSRNLWYLWTDQGC